MSKFGLNFALVIVSLCILVPSTWGSAKRPVQLGEIKTWEPMGAQWIKAFDDKGQLLAIYDLSYPSFGRFKSQPGSKPITMSVLDLSHKGYDQVYNFIADMKSRPENQAAETQGKYDLILNQLQKPAPGLSILSDAESILPDQWWRSVPWKQKSILSDQLAPRHFYLSDIDFKAVSTNPKEFERNVQKLSVPVLDQLEFQEVAPSRYEIRWTPQMASSGPMGSALKVIDLRCDTCGLFESLGWDGLKDTMTVLLSLIPVPVVSGFLKVAVRELYYFQRQLTVSHLEMALEMLHTADEQSKLFSPFSSLAESERVAAENYLLFAETVIPTSVVWLAKKPQDVWENFKIQTAQQCKDSESNLTGHGINLDFLNPRYAVGLDSNHHKKIYNLASPRYFNIIPPLASVDYSNPKLIRGERIAVETVGALVTFLGAFIPFPAVGSVISEIFYALIETPMHIAEDWDLRLSAHLLARENETTLPQKEDWSYERQLLFEQQLNPFEVSPSEAAELVKWRLQSLTVKN